MMSISLCMIVKNEEAVLDRCLSSIADLMDEIVIVDTGSTDGTKTIAEKYTDKVYDHPWNNDFSAARNFSFSKATMDYIYTADADEVLDLENHKRFDYLKRSLLPEIEIVQMKYITPDEFNTVMNIRDEYRPKLYKRLRQFRWIDPIHETVQTEPLVYNSDIEILHMPQSQHSERDFSLFIRAFQSGHPFSGKLHTMYARELFIAGSSKDLLQAMPIFQQSLTDDAADTRRLQEALCVLCRCARLQDNIADFFKYALHIIAYYPCSEVSYELGTYFYGLKDYIEAARWYHCAAYETSSILNVHTGGDLALSALSDCYARLADTHPDDAGYRKLAEDCRIAAAAWTMDLEDQK